MTVPAGRYPPGGILGGGILDIGVRALSSVAAWLTTVFTDDFSAFNAAGYTIPGTDVDVVVTDTEGKFNASASGLACAGGKASPAYGDPGIWWTNDGSDFDLIGSMAVFGYEQVSTGGANEIGVDNNTSGNVNTPCYWIQGGKVVKIARAAADPTVATLSGAANLALLFGSAYPVLGTLDGKLFTPLWVEASAAGLTEAGLAVSNYNDIFNLSSVSLYNIPALAGGDVSHVLVSDASFVNLEAHEIGTGGRRYQLTITRDAGLDQIEFRFGYLDSSNYLKIRTYTSNVNLYLQQIDGGSETTLGSAASALTAGVHTLEVIHDSDGSVVVRCDDVQVVTASVATKYSVDASVFSRIYGASTFTDLTVTPTALGIATDRLLYPTTSDTCNHAAESWVVLKGLTLPTANSDTVRLKGAATGDRLEMVISSDGSYTIRNHDGSSPGDTVASGAAASLVDGDNLVINCETGQGYNDGVSLGTPSATPPTTGAGTVQITDGGDELSFEEIYTIPIPVDLSKVTP